MHRDTPKLLIIEDDTVLAGLLMEYLAPHGFELVHVDRGDVAVERIVETQPDLVLLDLMLPGANGLDVCRRVRKHFAGVIMMLTASQSEADHVAGLELGADDFVIKPIEPRVLLARIRSQLRRGGQRRAQRTAPIEHIEVGALTVDRPSRRVTIVDVQVALTTMEFDILYMLASQAGAVVERDDMYTQVLGITYDGIDRGMDVHISRIRRKLGRAGFDPSRLRAVRGVGYLLAAR